MNHARLVVLGLAATLAACGAKTPRPAAAPSPTSAPSPTAAAAPAAPGAEGTPAPDFRAQPPTPGPTPALVAPVPERRVLPNGLTVLFVPKRELPLVSVHVLFKAGSADDPDALPGLAGFTADMLRSGTQSRPAQVLADEIETLGSHLSAEAGTDAMVVAAASLSTSFEPVLDIVSDVVQRSVFAPAEIERVRKRRLGALAEEKDDPERLAGRVFRRVVFGRHPYGHTVLGEEEAVAKIGRPDLVRFASLHLRPANAAIVIVGDLAAEQAFADVERRFGGWQGAPGAEPPPPPPKAQPPEIVLVPRPGAPQSQLRIGDIGIARTSPDYFQVLVMNEILGGMFNSRINMNLREDKGYTYGAYSYFDATRAPGPFVVGTGVRTDVTTASIEQVLAEIDGMRTRDVTDDELGQAKNGLALSLPGRFQTLGAVSAMMGNIFLYDLPLDYYRQFPARVQAVSKQAVRGAAEEHLVPEQLSVVVVGDPDNVRPGLELLHRGDVVTWPIRARPAPPAGEGSPR